MGSTSRKLIKSYFWYLLVQEIFNIWLHHKFRNQKLVTIYLLSRVSRLSGIKGFNVEHMEETNTEVSWTEFKRFIWNLNKKIVEATKMNHNSATSYYVLLFLKRFETGFEIMVFSKVTKFVKGPTFLVKSCLTPTIEIRGTVKRAKMIKRTIKQFRNYLDTILSTNIVMLQ